MTPVVHVSIATLYGLWSGTTRGDSQYRWPEPEGIKAFHHACDGSDHDGSSDTLITVGFEASVLPTCPACAVLYDEAQTQWAEEEGRRAEEARRQVLEDMIQQFAFIRAHT